MTIFLRVQKKFTWCKGDTVTHTLQHNVSDDKLFPTRCALDSIEYSWHERADTTGISESFRVASLE